MAILDFRKAKQAEPISQSSGSPPIQDKLLTLLMQFQQSLDAKELVTWFAGFIEQEIGSDGYDYTQSEQAISCRNGCRNRHKIAYTLTLEDQDLGEIRFYRPQPFSEPESRQIEIYLSTLIYPLSNALHYQKALNSAYIDPLTNLHNRASMLHVMQRLDRLSCRGEVILSLLIVDIDHFKRINDQFGHINGDRIIRQIAKRLSSNLRDSDHIFRYGGEEFVIILEGVNTPEAMEVADRIRQDVASHPCTLYSSDDANIKQQPVYMTVSVGISHCRNDDIMTLLNRADHALYTAKTDGRNKVIAEHTVR
ncbi:GGDEF domain-containing protein [Acidihalobacter prosperus]